ncbi:MAG TPA: LPS export ABC transporter periplasmic protein LptC, partial [Vicinamibacteria bacterium]|nr:LPS export ABC transporter periplasmic protein LptC [Vicinamibacteria bacterium]
MTLVQIRFLKRGLLLLFVASGAYVSHQVWQGLRGRESRSLSSLDEPVDPTSRQIEIQQLDSEGNVAWTLKAAESIGRSESAQQFRQVEIRFAAGKEETPVVVTADRCELRNDEAVFLEGNVVVRDEGSLRLEAATLEFRRKPDRVWTTEPVRYFRDGLAGDAGSMRYLIGEGNLELEEGVSMTLQRGSDAPVEVTSKRAVLKRRQNWLRYVDDVHVRHSDRSLACNDLQVYFSEDRESIEHLEAYENVDLRMNVS